VFSNKKSPTGIFLKIMRNRALKISKITESEFINQKIISVNLHYKEHINIRVVLSGQMLTLFPVFSIF